MTSSSTRLRPGDDGATIRALGFALADDREELARAEL